MRFCGVLLGNLLSCAMFLETCNEPKMFGNGMMERSLQDASVFICADIVAFFTFSMSSLSLDRKSKVI